MRGLTPWNQEVGKSEAIPELGNAESRPLGTPLCPVTPVPSAHQPTNDTLPATNSMLPGCPISTFLKQKVRSERRLHLSALST